MFFRKLPFAYNTLELSQGHMPPSVMSEGDYSEVVFEQQLVCFQIEKCTDCLSHR